MEKPYDLIEWYKLRMAIRVDLVSVIEDVRPGAKIEILADIKEIDGLEYYRIQKEYLEKCLKSAGLHYTSTPDGIVFASKDAQRLEQVASREIKEGEFLGYPECCIEAFEKGCAKYMESGESIDAPAVRFFSNVAFAGKVEEYFDATIMYLPYVPCSMVCEESLSLAEEIKKAMMLKDPEAACYWLESQFGAVYHFHYRDCTFFDE